LTSRYGVVITPDEVSRLLFSDFSTVSAKAATTSFDLKKDPDDPAKEKDPDDPEKGAALYGGGADAGGGILDLMELVMLLLIPRLRRQQLRKQEAKQRDDDGNNSDDDEHRELSGHVLGMLLHDAGILTDGRDDGGGGAGAAATKSGDGGNNEKDTGDGTDEGVALTKSVLKRLCRSLGETELAGNDALLDEMIQVVANAERGAEKVPSPSSSTADPAAGAAGPATGAPQLNASTFAAALVHDLGAYDPAGKWSQYQRTNLQDVFGSSGDGAVDGGDDDAGSSIIKNGHQKSAVDGDIESDAKKTKNANGTVSAPEGQNKVTFKRTAAFLDFAVDTFRSRLQVIFLWVFFGMSFFTYYSGVGTFITVPPCDNFEFRAPWSDRS